jgi:hypothetical protein
MHNGFAAMKQARFTVSCSYHVGLTSLLLSVPTILLCSNAYYRHKHEGLKRAFNLAHEMIVDVERVDHEALNRTLCSLVSDPSYSMAVRANVAQGSALMATQSVSGNWLLSRFLVSGYVVGLMERYDATVARLADTMAELGDLQFEHTRLLNLTSQASKAGKHVNEISKNSYGAYLLLVRRIREIVQTALPSGATVIVVSRGDLELVRLPGRRAWHFPQTDNGVYAGQYPADSVEAIAHLEKLRTAGGEYLLFPYTGFWWLDHYEGFRDHLDRQYKRVWSGEHCIIYRLVKADSERAVA